MESKTEGKMAAELDRDSKHDDADAGGDDTLVVAKGGSESCFVVGSAKAADSGSLQDAFNKFRRERSRALKLKAKQRAAEAKDPSLRAARADKLRAQFLEQAHKYKGVVRGWRACMCDCVSVCVLRVCAALLHHTL